MLDIDYNSNRMVVCGYQQHILKTVASMIQKKPNGANNKKGTQSNRRSQDRVGGYINLKNSPLKSLLQGAALGASSTNAGNPGQI